MTQKPVASEGLGADDWAGFAAGKLSDIAHFVVRACAAYASGHPLSRHVQFVC